VGTSLEYGGKSDAQITGLVVINPRRHVSWPFTCSHVGLLERWVRGGRSIMNLELA
jgi:hypothetical protein